MTEPPGVRVKAVYMYSEAGEEVSRQGELCGDAHPGEERELVGAPGHQGRDHQVHVGHPQVDVVQEKVAKGATENRVELETGRVLHQPRQERLEVQDGEAHAGVDQLCQARHLGQEINSIYTAGGILSLKKYLVVFIYPGKNGLQQVFLYGPA